MTQRCLVVRHLVVLVLLGSAWSAAWTFADDIDLQASLSPDQLVQEALHREVYGLQHERDRLLSTALRQAPDHAPSRWHQGFVSYLGDWTRADDIPQLVSQNPLFLQYQQERRKCADDLAGNLRMANWCRQHVLTDRERAHLSRVLDFAPDHTAARARLGYRLAGGQWKRETEIRQADERAEQRRTALVRWRGKIERLRNALRQRDEEKRLLAEARVREIQDPAAIAALETVLSESESNALLVVDTIDTMQGEESDMALIRQAVLSPWTSVRQAAARALGKRELERYVPLMLTEMYTPVTSRTQIVPDGNNRLVYRHAFLREGQDQEQLLVLDTRYRRLALPGGDGNETLTRALAATLGTAMNRERSVAQQNRQAEMLNQRLADALNIATGQQLPASPQSWWQWWDNDQDVVLQGRKQQRRIQRTTQVALVDRVQPSRRDGGIQVSGSRQPRRGECFAAGTPVWSDSGLLPIEAVRVGDLVLSQDPGTGELAYKPVLRTTVRPAERLVEVGEETFETSGGHLFWVAGDGWTRARELQSGMQLHCLTGSIGVYEISAGSTAETFNLVVADFATYFVGDSRVLSHDVTPRRPTDVLVPGLIDR